VTARHARAAATLIAGLALLAVVAWQSGAKAVHYASDPTHEPCPALTPGDHTLTVDTPEGARQVFVHAPRGAYKPRPLVIALHGAGETGNDFANDTGFSRLADREGFLVAYPSAGSPNAFWNMSGQVPGGSNDVEAIERSLDQLEAAACVDHARVFVTGVSNGGGMTARLGCELSERLAGVASGRRGLPLTAAVQARAPAAGARDPRHRRSGRPVRRKAARLQRQREAMAVAVAAHRRLPWERGSAATRTRGDRDRLAPLQRRDARRARAPRRAGPRLARRFADPAAARALRSDLADVGVLPQPAAAGRRCRRAERVPALRGAAVRPHG